MEGDYWGDAVLVTRLEHAPIVVERCPRELAFGRLDPGPFDPKPERRQPKPGQHGDVLAIPVIEVAGVAGRLAAGSPVDMLPPPPIGVGVAPLNLVRRKSGANKKPVGKPRRLPHGREVYDAPIFELDNWLRPEYDPVNRFSKAV
jgi:hypothetical protein